MRCSEGEAQWDCEPPCRVSSSILYSPTYNVWMKVIQKRQYWLYVEFCPVSLLNTCSRHTAEGTTHTSPNWERCCVHLRTWHRSCNLINYLYLQAWWQDLSGCNSYHCYTHQTGKLFQTESKCIKLVCNIVVSLRLSTELHQNSQVIFILRKSSNLVSSIKFVNTGSFLFCWLNTMSQYL